MTVDKKLKKEASVITTQNNRGTRRPVRPKAKASAEPITSSSNIPNTQDLVVPMEEDSCLKNPASLHPRPPINNTMYDAVMDEISDLLSAADEAQALGRLKLASSYLILSYVRLLGLGQRFDRTVVHLNHGLPLQENQSDEDDSNAKEMQVGGGEESTKSTTIKTSLEDGNATENTIMEHLAHAAMEFYSKRTGRKSNTEGTATGVGVGGGDESSPSPPIVADGIESCNKNKESHQDHPSVDVPSTTKIIETVTNSKATTTTTLKKIKGTKGKKKKTEMDNNEEEDDDEDEECDEDGVVRPKGTRGKRPPTKATPTMMNATFDARDIIMKWLLTKSSSSEMNNNGTIDVNIETPNVKVEE